MSHDFEGSSNVSTERDAYARFRREMLASHFLMLNDDRRRRAAHLQDTKDIVRAMAERVPIAGGSEDVDVRALGLSRRLDDNKL